MSDSTGPRRQPPSPLVFSKETALPPIALQSHNSQHGSGSGQNTVSMPFIKRHVTRRLKAAKQECDKELHRVTNAITTFFEERLREGDQDVDIDRDARQQRDSAPFHRADSEVEMLREPFVYQHIERTSAVQTDEASSDGGYEADPEGSHFSRQPSVSSSPSSLRRQNTLPSQERVAAGSTATSSPDPSNSRKSTWQGRISRRLSRSIHIPLRPSRSTHSSRSNSRSRSPLPVTTHNSFSESAFSCASPNRRSSRILVDDPVDPIMTALYEIIAVATDITDMSIAQLTAEPKVCSTLVQRVQNIGKVWDEHPDWHGRNWYVQVLLAVASLSRVVEWWEAEKQFWNFEEDDDEQAEPFTFLLKPVDEATHTPTSMGLSNDVAKHLQATVVAGDRLKLTRPVAQLKPRDTATSSVSREQEPSAATSRPLGTAESARVLATERLRLQAETVQSHNIVMELSLDGDHFQWINYAWEFVVGSDPQDMIGTRISYLLAAQDRDVFKNATQRLLADDSHTITIRFKMQVEPEIDINHPGTLYREMEGQGMLMLDHVDGSNSHTMWVVRPIAPPVWENMQINLGSMTEPSEMNLDSEPPSAVEDLEGEDAEGEGVEVGFGDRTESVPVTPFPWSTPISTATILCRICECEIPEWFFEKHNETCNDVHKFEADIGECNESIAELRNTIRELRAALDRSSPSSVPEYRGMPILSPATSPGPSSALQLFRPPLVSKLQRMNFKKLQKRLLDQLDDILSIAFEVATPALKEEESKEPIERQRLLSPTSERKITQVRNWCKPTTEDPALQRLVSDAELLVRAKVDNVGRMQNTIKYSEKVRQEWEERVEQTIAALNEMAFQEAEDALESEQEGEGEGEATEVEGNVEMDRASTTAQYSFKGDLLAPVPTPAAPTDAAAILASPLTHSPRSLSPVPQRGRTPAAFSGNTAYSTQTAHPLSRSVTPFSVSSPLASAAPINASPDRPESQARPSPTVESSAKTLRPRKSQGLEPKVTLTPPISPSISPRDATLSPHARRLSIISTSNHSGSAGPLSPRIPSVAPTSRSTPTSIKDFEVIKPISKGAFGSVFLAKKKVTGDYYAIKVLKKADMIAKNQITNVKAERMILMNQAESPFVAKLYYTFQSKDNLYLVMEYLNGGDCAALIKSLGSLPEEWTKNYIAEVVLGLEYLHQRGIIHRDLKPDNLLIDQHGHLKLTDFGLSRIGLLGRQQRDAVTLGVERMRARTKYSPGSRPPSMDAAYMSSPLLSADILAPPGGSYFIQRSNSGHHINMPPYHPSGTPTDDVSESSGSDSLSGGFFHRRTSRAGESPLQSFATELTHDLRVYSQHSGTSVPTIPGAGAGGAATPPSEQKFVGTPDYLAPESILGIAGDDPTVDWWALGVITYEFLYGFPPFHAESPDKVFENILSGHIDWHEDWVDYSPEARDFMEKLLNVDSTKRLGAKGSDEVKTHPFFDGIDWSKVTTNEAAFIPQVTDPESTDYFDLRGAAPMLFHDDEPIAIGQSAGSPVAPDPLAHSTIGPVAIAQSHSHSSHASTPVDDFGSFSFKNLPVLKQANDDVIRKMKTDQMTPIIHALGEPTQQQTQNAHMPHRRSISQRAAKKPPSVVTTGGMDGKATSVTNPPSPATSASSIASSPSRSSIPPTTPVIPMCATPSSVQSHSRRPSEFGAVERFKLNLGDDGSRRNSMPSRLRTASVSTQSNDGSAVSDHWPPSSIGGHTYASYPETNTPPSSVGSLDLRRGTSGGGWGASDPNDRVVTCLLAEDNPITAKIIETLLTRLGCRVVVVSDGSQAISVALGDIKFDCILMDLHMPVVDGESAAKYIKSTSNKNSSVPIISVSAYSPQDSTSSNSVFAASLAKPVSKADLIATMRQLGFKTSTQQDGRPAATKVIARS